MKTGWILLEHSSLISLFNYQAVCQKSHFINGKFNSEKWKNFCNASLKKKLPLVRKNYLGGLLQSHLSGIPETEKTWIKSPLRTFCKISHHGDFNLKLKESSLGKARLINSDYTLGSCDEFLKNLFMSKCNELDTKYFQFHSL